MKATTSNRLFELLSRSLAPDKHIQPGEPSETIGHPDRKDWLAVISLAEQNEVCGLVYDSVLALPKEQQPDLEVMMRWTAIIQSIERDNRLYRQRLSESFDVFEKRQYIPILMKGLTLSELYPEPLHRPVGDVDIFVPIDQQKEISQCLRQIGGKVDIHYDVKHTTAQYQGLNWELHYRTMHFFSIMHDKRYHLLELEETATDNLYHETIEGHTVPVFPPMFNIIYLTAHFQHHLLLGKISLRQVVDWMLALNHDRAALGIAEANLIRTLKRVGLYRLYCAMGYIAIHHLGYSESGYAGLARLTPADRLRGRLLLRMLITGHAPGCKPFHPWLVSDGLLQRINHFIELCKRCFVLFDLCPLEALSTPSGFIYQACKRRRAAKKE